MTTKTTAVKKIDPETAAIKKVLASVSGKPTKAALIEMIAINSLREAQSRRQAILDQCGQLTEQIRQWLIGTARKKGQGVIRELIKLTPEFQGRKCSIDPSFQMPYRCPKKEEVEKMRKQNDEPIRIEYKFGGNYNERASFYTELKLDAKCMRLRNEILNLFDELREVEWVCSLSRTEAKTRVRDRINEAGLSDSFKDVIDQFAQQLEKKAGKKVLAR